MNQVALFQKRTKLVWKNIGLVMLSLAISACATHRDEMDNTPKRYYVVKENDNFYAIAFAFEITTRQLQLANPWLNPSNIAPGLRLTIPTGVSDGHAIMPGQNSNFIWPVKSVDISSRYGYRDGSLHAGMDLRAPRGTQIIASAAGRVIFSGRKNGYGLMVVIDHGGGIETAYAHNQRNIVKLGERVNQGQQVARVGRSGNATGFHVHFELRKLGKAVNPAPYLNAGL